MSFSFWLDCVSMTDTELERPLATYSLRPSGVIAMFHGRLPMGTVAMTVLVATSITETVASLPFETYTRLPSGCIVTPFE